MGQRHHRQIDAFRSAVNDCGLVDLGYVGAKFTWCNHRQDGLVRERLDRGLATASWMRVFPHAKVLHLVCTTSDHVLILLDVEGHKSTPCNQGWRSPIYRFEAMWLREEECEDIVRNNWSLEGDSTVRGLRRNLESVWSLCVQAAASPVLAFACVLGGTKKLMVNLARRAGRVLGKRIWRSAVPVELCKLIQEEAVLVS
ncbi:hypothetical protein LOK49_LG13G02901 [Camellia lanceoleosa]|uniref:Uncharacterized protein n=1 Tax=Camellia lanceoleosa TaxID=1840588 RepID=A0ACC0FKB0_9ERIC|nr:hypothetical protein LOK49_LG13G02901 [Camellia lanceoleosa]